MCRKKMEKYTFFYTDYTLEEILSLKEHHNICPFNHYSYIIGDLAYDYSEDAEMAMDARNKIHILWMAGFVREEQKKEVRKIDNQLLYNNRAIFKNLICMFPDKLLHFLGWLGGAVLEEDIKALFFMSSQNLESINARIEKGEDIISSYGNISALFQQSDTERLTKAMMYRTEIHILWLSGLMNTAHKKRVRDTDTEVFANQETFAKNIRIDSPEDKGKFIWWLGYIVEKEDLKDIYELDYYDADTLFSPQSECERDFGIYTEHLYYMKSCDDESIVDEFFLARFRLHILYVGGKLSPEEKISIREVDNQLMKFRQDYAENVYSASYEKVDEFIGRLERIVSKEDWIPE